MEVLQRTANRGSISTGYDIENSLKTQANAGNEWFYRSSPTTGNKRTFTFSFWIKRTQLTGFEADPYLMSQGTNARFHFAGDALRFMFDGSTTELEASGVLRDTSAWYHIVLAVDTTQATAANRVKAYLNGQDYDWNNTKYPTQNQEGSWMSGTSMYFNTRDGDGSYDNSGYWSEVVVVDGQQLDPTSFGEFDEDSGIWKPKDLSDLTFGSEGFYYKFDNASSLGEDSSGNGNDATLNNITAADQATDTPTNNFTTWNVLPLYNSNIFSFPNGATEVDRTSGTGWTTAYSSLGANKGKWYAEFQILTSGNYLMNGNVPLAKIQSVYATQFYLGSEASAAAGAGYYSSGTTGNDAIYHDATFTGSGVTTSAGDIISVAMDCDNNKIHFAVNGTYTNSSNPATNTNGFNMTDDYQFFAHATLTGSQTWKNNFGGYTTISISSAASDANGYGTFEYAPPSGYYALCTKNLAEYG